MPFIDFGTLVFEIKLSYYVACAIGAFVLFFRLQKKGKVLFEVVGHIVPEWADSPYCRIAEAIIFISLGSIVGCILTQPTNAQQAIAAGLGWTGLITNIKQ